MRKFLERHGWIRNEVRRQGCFKHVLWLDPKTNQVFPQHQAVDIQRARNGYGGNHGSSVVAVNSPDPSATGTATAVDVADDRMVPTPAAMRGVPIGPR
jgi:hypothetical protein